MFAPAAGWNGMNTVFITIRGGAVSNHFMDLVKGWGSQCISMASGQEHDTVTAAVQNATHSALISFGLCLQKIGYDAEMAAQVSTPPHRALIGIIQRMANINEPDTYWDIQTDNPNSEQTWEKLEEAVAEVHSAVKSRDRFEKFPSPFSAQESERAARTANDTHRPSATRRPGFAPGGLLSSACFLHVFLLMRTALISRV